MEIQCEVDALLERQKREAMPIPKTPSSKWVTLLWPRVGGILSYSFYRSREGKYELEKLVFQLTFVGPGVDACSWLRRYFI